MFVWLTLILLGYIVHRFKRWSLGYYGLGQIVCGLIGGYVAVSKLPLATLAAWLALIASASAVVSGCANVEEATSKGTSDDPGKA